MTASPQFDATLLDILRCPEAVHFTDKGADPGKLRVVRDGYWLVSDDSGNKYPVIDGIPKMLIEEGRRWKALAIDELPVPPPTDDVASVAEDALPPELQEKANQLRDRAVTVRQSSIETLRQAATELRREGLGADNSVLLRNADQLADELEQAANAIQNKPKPQPAPAPAPANPTWPLLAGMFAVGLFIGGILRGNQRGK
ncbi:MAG: Trm112 family protein [Phototrophicaceae bacterium]|jgi:uncharacterized protein YbaR (Trm112 family)